MIGNGETERGALHWALDYASRGWHVFPVHGIDPHGSCHCGNPGCSSPGKHPRVKGGFKSASVDPRQIEAWWQKWPEANVGIATGHVSGLWVLDIDNAEREGLAALAALQQTHGDLPTTLSARTGSGVHLIFSLPAEAGSAPGSARRLGPSLDVRADGGYIVVAPSRHHSGRDYVWENWSTPLAELPGWLFENSRRNVGNSPPQRASGAIPEGARNNTLFARGIGALRRGIEPTRVPELLHRANQQECSPPLTGDEVETIATNVQNARTVDNYACTDIGNGDRVVEAIRDRVRHVDPPGYWISWDSRVWRRVSEGRIVEMAKGRLRQISELANDVSLSPDARQRFQGWGNSSQAAMKVRAAVQMARVSTTLHVEEDALDDDVGSMNMPNGILDLATATLRPHDRQAFMTRMSGVEYDPNASSPEWDSFVDQLTCGDETLRAALQCACGYASLGVVNQQVAFILFGEGANGKSTFLSLIQRALGDYGGTAPPNLLARRKGEPHPTELWVLRSKRVVSVQEVDFEGGLDENRFKLLTGGDRLQARQIRQDFSSFEPSHTLFIASNHMPRFRDQSCGMSRRVVVLPTNARLAPECRLVSGRRCDGAEPQLLFR